MIKQIEQKLKELSGLKNPLKLVLLIPKSEIKLPSFEEIQVRQVGGLKGHLWEQFILPLASKDGLLVNFCNTAPMFKQNQIVLIHDMGVYRAAEGYSPFFIFFYKILFFFLRVRTNHFVTVSDFSKSEIHNVLKIPKEKINVIKNGADHMLSIIPDQSILTRFQLSKPYVLSVGSRNPKQEFQAYNEGREAISR